MSFKSFTLLEYLVTIDKELTKLKKVVTESVGADYSELIANIDGIRNELNTFKTSITDTVNTNNSEITSKFNSLEQQFNTFKTSITNTVNTNNTNITSQVNTINSQFNEFKTSIASQVSSLTTRMTSVESRVTNLENNSSSSGGSSGGVPSEDFTALQTKHNEFETYTKTELNNLLNMIYSLSSRVGALENNTNSRISEIENKLSINSNNVTTDKTNTEIK